MKKRKRRPQWQPFQKATNMDAFTEADVTQAAEKFGMSKAKVRDAFAEVEKDTVFLNNFYQVNIRIMETPEGFPDVLHLSVKSINKTPIRDWRHMQRIKNELVGPEHEGFELYPAESRLLDAANQYHMFVFVDPAYRFPFGFDSGRSVQDDTSGTKGKQRPLDA